SQNAVWVQASLLCSLNEYDSDPDSGIAPPFQPDAFWKFDWTISVQFEAENTLQGGAMLLCSDEAHLFFKLHSSLMCFVNERLEIVPGARNPDGYRTLSADLRLKTRNALLDNMNLIEMFVDVNPFKFSGEDLNIVLSWKH